MLDSKITKKINDFIYLKPRTVQEVANLISKNWRTADRYVDSISKEKGNISVRTFRGGTRGALKIVYWNNIEKIHSSEFQEKLLKKIERSKKMDFSPFDIYQYVDDAKRNAKMINVKNEKVKDVLKDYLESAQKQVLSFSGNLSWINLDEGGKKITDLLEEMAENNVSIKILTRVTIDSMKNIKKVLEINEKLGKNLIEIRHREHPLRGFIIDDNKARFREMKDPTEYAKGELDDYILLFYEIYDP
ncbi:MAG: hypothetical protein KKG13_04960, partial [Nanoarchaeota archaeon]|nr:hypothetical protein [Nanoarchaeota archaeon]